MANEVWIVGARCKGKRREDAAELLRVLATSDQHLNEAERDLDRFEWADTGPREFGMISSGAFDLRLQRDQKDAVPHFEMWFAPSMIWQVTEAVDRLLRANWPEIRISNEMRWAPAVAVRAVWSRKLEELGATWK